MRYYTVFCARYNFTYVREYYNIVYLLRYWCLVKQIAHFARYAESIPDGETSVALSEAARKNNVYVIGGTIPERSYDKLYNTCTVWGPDGKLVAKHRKVKIDVVYAFIIYNGFVKEDSI